jgi:hypothetical protein
MKEVNHLFTMFLFFKNNMKKGFKHKYKFQSTERLQKNVKTLRKQLLQVYQVG